MLDHNTSQSTLVYDIYILLFSRICEKNVLGFKVGFRIPECQSWSHVRLRHEGYDWDFFGVTWITIRNTEILKQPALVMGLSLSWYGRDVTWNLILMRSFSSVLCKYTPKGEHERCQYFIWHTDPKFCLSMPKLGYWRLTYLAYYVFPTALLRVITIVLRSHFVLCGHGSQLLGQHGRSRMVVRQHTGRGWENGTEVGYLEGF